MHHTTKYDNDFNKIPFYKKYPEYLPFIGKKFDENSKILLLGESHYLPKSSVVHKNPSNWYKGSNSLLSGEEPLWINTRRVVNNIHGKNKPIPQKWKRSRTIYRNIEKALIESGLPVVDNLFCNLAFMNSFQRPAEVTGESIDVHPIDIEESAKVINRVIEIIKPEHICFVSSKASKSLVKHLKVNFEIDTVSHPASVWWNRESRKGISRELFIQLMREYNVKALGT